MKRLTKAEVIEQLSALAASGVDAEVMHSHADNLLLAHVADDVAGAYVAVQDAADFWATA